MTYFWKTLFKNILSFVLYDFVTCVLKCLCLLQKHGTTSKPLKPVRLDSEVKIKLFNYIIMDNYV